MKKGFTLVELLVVITILAILAAIALTSFQSAQKSARDAQRKSDLNQYRIALENYATNNGGKYPDTNDCDGATCIGNTCYDPPTGIFNSASSPIIPAYLPALIDDPSHPRTAGCGVRCGGGLCNYRYYASGGGLSYVLYADLENNKVWEVCSTGQSGPAACLNPTTCQPQSGYGILGCNTVACNVPTCNL